MKFLVRSIAVLGAMLILSSCASIVSSSRWPLSVKSDPVGAHVVIKNKKGVEVYTGITPATMSLKSGSGYFGKENYLISLKMDGFAEKTIPINCNINGWYFGNLLIGGLLGMLIIDPITGAMYRLDTKTINTLLEKTTVSAGPELKIINYSDVPENIRSSLIAIKE